MVEEAWKRGPARGGNSTVVVAACETSTGIATGTRAANEAGEAADVWLIAAVATGAGSMTTRQHGVRDGCPAVRASCSWQRGQDGPACAIFLVQTKRAFAVAASGERRASSIIPTAAARPA